MRLTLALLTALALTGIAFAGDCAVPYRRPAYQRSVAPPVAHDDVIIFTQFQIVTPAVAAVPATAAATPSPSPELDGPPVVRAASVSGGAGVTTPGAAVEVLRANCLRCHGGGKSSGGVVIFSPDGRFTPNRDALDLMEAVLSGAMPPTGKLSAADKKTLRQLLKG